MMRPRGLVLWIVISLLVVAGCRPRTGTTQPPAGTLTVTPAPAAVTPTSATPAVAGDRTLILWLPPSLMPNSETPAGQMIRDRLAMFAEMHPEAQVEVRVKAVGGPGGLLDALTTADAAAPAVLPDLVALPQDLLRQAVQRELLASIALPADEDWYPFALQLGQAGEQTYGLAFAADALALVSPRAAQGELPGDWGALAAGPSPLAFPAADPRALAVLLFYRAAGGGFFDEQGAIRLDAVPLRRTFDLLQTGRDNGVFPHWLTQYDQDALVWQALLEGRTSRALLWVSNPLQPDAPVKTVTLPFGPDGTAFTLVSGWLWAFPARARGDTSLARSLAEYLTAGDFLGPWLRALGYLPPRSAALTAWGTEEEQALAAQVGLLGESLPEQRVIDALGPLLSETTVALLKGQIDADQATQTVLEALNP